MADIDINTDSWRSHAQQVDGIGRVVEQGGSAYMAALDGNVFGVFTPMVLPAYITVSRIFAQRNTEFVSVVQKGPSSSRMPLMTSIEMSKPCRSVSTRLASRLGNTDGIFR